MIVYDGENFKKAICECGLEFFILQDFRKHQIECELVSEKTKKILKKVLKNECRRKKL